MRSLPLVIPAPHLAQRSPFLLYPSLSWTRSVIVSLLFSADCDSNSYSCSGSYFSKSSSASYRPLWHLSAAARTHPAIYLHLSSQAADFCTSHLYPVLALDSDAAPRTLAAAVSSQADYD